MFSSRRAAARADCGRADSGHVGCVRAKAARAERAVLASNLPLENIARITRTLAVLLGGGINPANAWRHTRDAYGIYPIQFEAACSAAAKGRDAAAAIAKSDFSSLSEDERKAWLSLACAWWIGSRAGANLAAGLLSLSQAFSEIALVQREIKVALSSPAATARLVSLLPLFSIALGFALGFNPLQILLFTPPGWFCLIAGIGLMVLARRWNRALLRKAQPKDNAPGLDYELCVIAVSGGRSLKVVWEGVQAAMKEFTLPVVNQARVEQLIELSLASGAPVASLLQAESELARLQARTEAQQAVQRLGVKLMVPLGVCVLPAFVLLGVVPLVMSILGGGF